MNRRKSHFNSKDFLIRITTQLFWLLSSDADQNSQNGCVQNAPLIYSSIRKRSETTWHAFTFFILFINPSLKVLFLCESNLIVHKNNENKNFISYSFHRYLNIKKSVAETHRTFYCARFKCIHVISSIEENKSDLFFRIISKLLNVRNP